MKGLRLTFFDGQAVNRGHQFFGIRSIKPDGTFRLGVLLRASAMG